MSLYNKLNSENKESYDNLDNIQVSLQPENSYFLHGVAGCSKTFSALQHAKKFIAKTNPDERDEDQNIRFIEFIDLIKLAQKSFAKGDEGWEARRQLEEYKTSFYLILDDMGTEKQTEFVDQAVYEIINWRHGNNMITVFTSNHSLEEIGEKYHARISSRITKMCGIENIIQGENIDYRKFKKDKPVQKHDPTNIFAKNKALPDKTRTQEQKHCQMLERTAYLLAGIRNKNEKLYSDIKSGKNTRWNLLIAKSIQAVEEDQLESIFDFSEAIQV
jgi:DNA replication protein DnaC